MTYDPSLLAKLRTLFSQDRSRTVIYDLLVSTGALACPDPEVKALADREIAAINTPLPIDPAPGVYLCFQKLAKGEPADKALALLDGYDAYLRYARIRVIDQRMPYMQMGNISRVKPADVEAMRERLGFPKPAVVENPPAPPSAYDRLQFFNEANKLNSPEAVELAREVLFKFIDSKYPSTSPAENIAIHTLVFTKNFPAFLTDLKSRMKGAGRSELEIQRALYRFHLYRIVHSKGEISPFAKRVLELDPTDTAAAADVLEAATTEQNRPLAIKALETLCHQSRPLLQRALQSKQQVDGEIHLHFLSLFTGAQARVLAEALLHIPLPQQKPTTDYNPPDFRPLYLHFAQYDMDSLKPLMRWAGDYSPGHATELNQVADFLIRAKRLPEAVDLLAEAYFTPPLAAGDHFTSPQKPFLANSPRKHWVFRDCNSSAFSGP